MIAAAVRWRPLDVALALLLGAVAIAEALVDRPPGGVVAHLLLAAPITAIVLLRRSWPVTAMLACAATAVVKGAVSGFEQPSSAAWLLALVVAYGGGRDGRGRSTLGGLALMIVVLEATWIAYADATATDYFYPAFFVVLAFAAGRMTRQHVRLGADLHETAARAQERAEHERELARAHERRRIAREMHDVIAHSVSVMVVQAGGARRILDRDPARAQAAAALVEQTGRETLGELRTLLGAIDGGGPDAAIAPPAPSLERVEELIGRARAAGLEVTLEQAGRTSPLPAGVDMAAYRIVQEALTNVLRHAGPVPTVVVVRRSRDALEVEVRNVAGSGSPGALSRPGGHGLLGMVERAGLYGGRLDAGPQPGGGFAVRARLPLSERMEIPV
ncbi:two-component system sensor kinase [Patulibacter medicamentivorans]|uniref:histidine kinase n=1 Tax=Patulibacter medicamentivorans TaxID=1097667 RepID=H0E6G2_9ACTN|nr:histidine kinase [Patulibacter medicamentivorans]EHN10751.1 two-component system sensor kinase [Patulibacter medicamentivorans]